jgi:hypothetical protein
MAKDWNTEIAALRTRADDVVAAMLNEPSTNGRIRMGNLANNLRKKADELEVRRDSYARRRARAVG